MGYGKSKPGMFKMKHQGVPALMKALVGDQHKLPEHLKEAIKNAPAKKDPDAKKKALEKARKAREEFQRKNPDAKFKTETKQPAKPKSEIKTTVKGDLPSGGYSPEQKKKAVAQAAKTAAEKKRAKLKAEGKDVDAANKRFRKNTTMGRALTRQGY